MTKSCESNECADLYPLKQRKTIVSTPIDMDLFNLTGKVKTPILVDLFPEKLSDLGNGAFAIQDGKDRIYIYAVGSVTSLGWNQLGLPELDAALVTKIKQGM